MRYGEKKGGIEKEKWGRGRGVPFAIERKEEEEGWKIIKGKVDRVEEEEEWAPSFHHLLALRLF